MDGKSPETKPAPIPQDNRESVHTAFSGAVEGQREESSLHNVHEQTKPRTKTQALRNFDVPLFPVRRKKTSYQIVYSPEIAQTISYLVAEGWTLSALSAMPGMPSVLTIKSWCKNYPEFKEAMTLAKEARAEVLADAALLIASKSKFSTHQSDKLKIDTALKLASHLDRENFGSHTKVTTETDHKITYVIQTNVPSQHKTIEIDSRDPAEVFAEEDAKKGIHAKEDSSS